MVPFSPMFAYCHLLLMISVARKYAVFHQEALRYRFLSASKHMSARFFSHVLCWLLDRSWGSMMMKASKIWCYRASPHAQAFLLEYYGCTRTIQLPALVFSDLQTRKRQIWKPANTGLPICVHRIPFQIRANSVVKVAQPITV